MCSKLNRRFKSKCVTGINESKALTKHISCKCKCGFDGRKCSSDQRWNNDKFGCECKKCDVLNPATSSCENGKHLASIMDDSAIICDEVIDTVVELNGQTIFFKKKATVKIKISIFAFFLIAIALLTAVSIYCYLVNFQRKRKHLLLSHFISSKIEIQIKNA